MNAKEFYQRFITAIHNDKPHAEEIYQKSSLYTPYVKNIIGKILGNADPLNHIEVNHEYYRVDVFAWKRAEGRMLSKKPSEIFREQLWKPVAAIEHENDCNSWMDEVIKLSYLKIPLKAVICYVPVNKQSSEHEYIDYVSAALSLLGYEESEDEEFLLIIGNARPQDRSEYFGYKPYLYHAETKRFEQQTNWNGRGDTATDG